MERFFKTDKLNVEAIQYGRLRRDVACNASAMNGAGTTRRAALSRRDGMLLTVDFSLRGKDRIGGGRIRRDAINRVSTFAAIRTFAVILALFAASFAAQAQYNTGDIAVINDIIDNNRLSWTKANPADGSYVPSDWSGVTWSTVATSNRITKLMIYSEGLTGSLDVSGLTALKELACSNNQLTALNVSGLTALEKLDCYDNRLTALNVSGLTALEYLYCNNNQLTALDVSGLTALKRIDCYDNQLTALTGLSGLTALQTLYCNGNQLTALDVSGLNSLQSLDCRDNQLTKLDLSGLNSLTSFGGSSSSTVSLSFTGSGSSYTATADMKAGTTFGAAGLTYDATTTTLTSTSRAVTSTTFSSPTGLNGYVLTGTLTLVYPSPATLDGTVTVSGTTTFGQTLTAVTTGLTSTPSVPLSAFSYQWQRSGTNIGGATGATYTLVQEDIAQAITVVVSESTCDGSVKSSATTAIGKAPQAAPSAPTLAGKTTNSITLNTIADAAYSKDGGAWQSSATFSGLTPNTSYTFTAYLPETQTHSASTSSPALSVTTDALPTYAVMFSVTGAGGSLAATVDNAVIYSGANVQQGKSAVFTATPNSGYRVKAWKDNGATVNGNTTNTYTISSLAAAQTVTVEFEAIPATVTGVTVNPATIQVQQGTTQQFAATVNGTDSPPQTVTWSVTGGTGSTNISATGLLTVDAAQSGSLTVTATSTYDTGKNGTATVTVTTGTPNPAYSISLGTSGTHAFPAATAGYGTQSALTVIATNTGNQPTGALTVALSGTNASAFSLSAATVNSLATGGNASFTVAPQTGLATATYAATVTVSGGNGITASFSVSFTVNPALTCFVTVSSASAGASGGGSYTAGATVSVNAGTPPAGQQFTGWTASPTVAFANASSASTTFTMPASAVTVTANFTTIVTDAETPTISSHPYDYSAYVDDDVTLNVTATRSDGGTLSYQWYRNTSNSASGGTAISGATSDYYSPSTSAAGTAYYYVKVTNTNASVNGLQTVTATSYVAKVTAQTAYGITAPLIVNGAASISPKAAAGETVTLTVTPDAGYVLDAIIVYKAGNRSVSVPVVKWSATTYSFVMPAYAVDISITFKLDDSSVEIVQPVKKLAAYSRDGLLHVSGLTVGARFSVYDLSGILVYQNIAESDEVEITLPGRGIYLVSDGAHTVKIVF